MNTIHAFEPSFEEPAQVSDAGFGGRVLPHNLDAEQALLGAILVNNEAYHQVSDFLRDEHFFDPVHARIFETCQKRIENGQLVAFATIRTVFEDDPGLEGLGGAGYIRDLAEAAETIMNADQFGRVIHDLAMRRGLIQVAEASAARAYDGAAEENGRQQIEIAEQALFKLAEEGDTGRGAVGFPAVLTSTVDAIQRAFQKEGKITGVPTGLIGLDEKLGGLQRSDLLILAGRPSMGKTALGVTMAINAASQLAVGLEADGLKSDNYTVAIFSLEMSAEQLGMRLLSAEAKIPSDKLRRGDLDDDGDFDKIVRASQSLADRPLFIDDTPAISIAQLRARARRIKRRHGLSLLVVDYLQLMKGSAHTANQGRVQEISEISQGLKAIAKELDVPVMALSQLSRAVESRDDKRPMLSDLRESGSIEQDADVVMFVYRDEYYQERAEPKQRADEKNDKFKERYDHWLARFQESKNQADVIIAKQRNGPIGTVRMQFDGQFGRFHDIERGNYDDGPYY